MARLQIKAVPNASRNGIAGWVGDALKVRVMAPPERGRANLAIAEVIAQALEIAVERVQIVAGETSERKVIEVMGFMDDELRQAIERCLAK